MIFQREATHPGAAASVSRSLSQMDLNRHNIQAVIHAAKVLRVEYESPIWRGSAIAHVGFPKQKIAVWGHSTSCNRQIFIERKMKWKTIKWELVGLPQNVGDDPIALRKELAQLLGLK